MDAVEEIKSKLAVEDVVSEYVQLKRAGRNLKGLSPFTSEKTASLMVSPEKQIWHDFSSGKGGDLFSFVMEVEGLDFRGALDLLARRAGIDLEQFQTSHGPSGFGKLKERLYAANELAAKFYQAQFKQNKTALKYIFEKRDFNKETVLTFRIGYSPNNGTALFDFLRRKDFTEQELQKAGLITRNYRGVHDIFRGRIQIPLADPEGRIVGFTARILEDNPNAPKYLNTPQTPLYDKGRHVYGLHLAKEAIRRNDFVVLVEGNLDVVSSHQAGIQQVVATAGTALTEMQLKTLKRFTGDVRLAFDQDRAGLTAAERAIPLASKVDIGLSMITIPAGKDPDELVRNDPVAWTKVIQEPEYALDWLIKRYATELDLTTAVGKRKFSDIVLRVVRQLPDHVEQDHYLGEIAKMTDVSKAALAQKLRGQPVDSSARLRKTKAKKPDPIIVDQTKNQDHLLAVALMQPPLRTYLTPITYDMLVGDPAHQLLRFFQDNPGFSGDPQTDDALRDAADYVKILILQYEELYQGLELLELRNEAARLQTRLIEQYVRNQKQPLIEALAQADDQQTAELLEQAKKLDELLKSYR